MRPFHSVYQGIAVMAGGDGRAGGTIAGRRSADRPNDPERGLTIAAFSVIIPIHSACGAPGGLGRLRPLAVPGMYRPQRAAPAAAAAEAMLRACGPASRRVR